MSDFMVVTPSFFAASEQRLARCSSSGTYEGNSKVALTAHGDFRDIKQLVPLKLE
jgi:hypothetical protein